MKKLIARTIALLLCGHVLLFYALPLEIFALVFIALAIYFLLTEWQNAIMVSMSLAIGTLIFGVFLQLSGLNQSVYYRPHEMFKVYDSEFKHGRYKKNVHFKMTIPHGDLKAFHEKVIPEPRRVTFHTDSMGFRNSRDYHGQEHILVGDSFIVGNGTTQEETIVEQLFRKHGIDVYSLAFTGDITSYAKYLRSFKRHQPTQVKVFLFLFEGNDFPLVSQETPVPSEQDSLYRKPLVKKLNGYLKLFNKTDIYRFTYSSTRKIFEKRTRKKERVEHSNIMGLPVAFFKDYIEVTKRDFLPENPALTESLCSLKNDITHLFFIPTKYRVYYKYINHDKQQKKPVLPNKQWELVKSIGSKCGISLTDLTPALIEKSDKLLWQGTLTYWSDDTHWNQHGISVAAELVKEIILTQ